MRFFRSRVFVACATGAFTAVLVGGVAWAVQSPVDGSGVIHACYNPNNGNLHLNVTGSCPTTGQRTPITWNAQGPQGLPGAPGVQGPPGPGAVYFAETTSAATTDPLAADVDGFGITLGCNLEDPSGLFAIARVDASWHGTDPKVGSVTDFETHAGDGSTANVTDVPLTGVHLHEIRGLSSLSEDPGRTHTDYAQGFVVTTAVSGLASQVESGFWFSMYFSTAGPDIGPATCTVTGVAVPISGSRSIPINIRPHA